MNLDQEGVVVFAVVEAEVDAFAVGARKHLVVRVSVRDHQLDANPSVTDLLPLVQPVRVSRALEILHECSAAALHPVGLTLLILEQDFHSVARDATAVRKVALDAKAAAAGDRIQPGRHLTVIVGLIVGAAAAECGRFLLVEDLAPARHALCRLRPRIRVGLMSANRRAATRRGRRLREIDRGKRGSHCNVVLSVYYFSLPSTVANFSFNFFHDERSVEFICIKKDLLAFFLFL